MKLKILITSLLLVFAASSQAATFYVNGATGDDTKDCATVENACKTPWKAYDVAAVGDQILITKGEYSIPAGCHFEVAKAVAFKGGYNATFDDLVSRSNNAEDTIITGKNEMTCRLLVLRSGHNEWVSFDTLTFTGAASGDNDHGALFSVFEGSWLRLNNVIIRDTIMRSGEGALKMGISGDKLEITNSRFENNKAKTNGGAIAIVADTEVVIDSTSFIDNIAPNDGAAIYATHGNITITNSTFSGNVSLGTDSQGTLVLDGVNRVLLRYNTIADNEGKKSGGLALLGTTNAELQANLILNNKNNSAAESNLVLKENTATIDDWGYNYIGSATQSGFIDASGVLLPFSTYFDNQYKGNPTSVIPSAALSEIIWPLAYNGGPLGNKTYKLKEKSVARDVIPDDSILFYGMGVSVDNPFTSLQQARAAVGLDEIKYKPGTHFYFDLGGSYNETTNAFEVGSDANLKFRVVVDEHGWVKTDKFTVGSNGVIQVRGSGTDQWVLGEPNMCSGLINTDGRGLPRSDRVKAEEVKSKCDVGAFEFNDFYQKDCWDEDGMRPENTLQSTDLSWCFNPFDGFTPQDLIDNLGAFHWYWSLVLLGLLSVRRKLK